MKSEVVMIRYDFTFQFY